MGDSRENNLSLFALVFIAICAYHRSIAEERQHLEFRSNMGHLNEIPKRFEIKGENAAFAFRKYINDINDLAKKENVTIKYKVKVEKSKLNKKHAFKTEMSNKKKTKKYNVPLKRKNMKLSNFEIILRKHADAMIPRVINDNEEIPLTTEKQVQIITAKPLWIGKYKPIISQVKTNYTKIIKPVRVKEITLTR